LGGRRGCWSPQDHLVAMLKYMQPCWFFSTCVNYNSNHGKFWSKDAIGLLYPVGIWRCRSKINSAANPHCNGWMIDYLSLVKPLRQG
jgi:hypothetical protein